MLLLNYSPRILQAASEQEHNGEQNIQIEDSKILTIEILQYSIQPKNALTPHISIIHILKQHCHATSKGPLGLAETNMAVP
jgi:hypothetical protein